MFDREERSQETAWVWAVSSALAVTTTKYVLVETKYPMVLLAVELALAAAVFLSQSKSRHLFRGWYAWPSAMCQVAALILLSGSVANFINHRTLPMFFLLPYVVECLSTQLCLLVSDRTRLQPWAIGKSVAILALSVVVFLDDYRQDLRGDLFLLIGLLCLSNTTYRICFTRAEARYDLAEPEFWEHHSAITLLLGVAAATATAFLAEVPQVAVNELWNMALDPFLWINLISAAVALSQGLSLAVYPSRENLGGPLTTGDSSILLTTSISMLLANFIAPLVELTYQSPIQTLAFSAIIVIAVAPVDSIAVAVKGPISLDPPPSRLHTFCVSMVLIFALNLILISWSQLSVYVHPDGQPRVMKPNLDLNYIHARPLDIVVSHYDECLDELADTLATLKALPNIAPYSPSVHIYTKHPDADLALIQEITQADAVTQLDNVGREGGTYLTHILDNWDNLAGHTLFMQGALEQRMTPTRDQVITRVRNYFNPDTGMLPLGYTDVYSCADISDRYDFEDSFHLLPQIYARTHARDQETRDANNTLFQPLNPLRVPACSRSLLTFKGMFIASAARIRGPPNAKTIFESISNILHSPHSPAHVRVSDGGRLPDTVHDELSEPYFGYAIERMWGGLLQCTDTDIVWKCPSMMSGWRRGGSVTDCQCMDEQYNGWRYGS